MAHEGGCACGKIRYRASGTPLCPSFCHCSICRRTSGAPVVAWATFRTEQLEWLSGTPRTFASSPKAVRSFCGDCGTPVYVWNEARPETRGIRIGTIDDANFVHPKMHLWVSRALASTNLNDDLEKFDRQPR